MTLPMRQATRGALDFRNRITGSKVMTVESYAYRENQVQGVSKPLATRTYTVKRVLMQGKIQTTYMPVNYIINVPCLN